jgi:hypothetical protein
MVMAMAACISRQLLQTQTQHKSTAEHKGKITAKQSDESSKHSPIPKASAISPFLTTFPSSPTLFHPNV